MESCLSGKHRDTSENETAKSQSILLSYKRLFYRSTFFFVSTLKKYFLSLQKIQKLVSHGGMCL